MTGGIFHFRNPTLKELNSKFVNIFAIQRINPYPPNIFFRPKNGLLFTSAAYIQVHFRLYLIMEGNTMNPDKTAPLGVV